jgi:hypothetical protein
MVYALLIRFLTWLTLPASTAPPKNVLTALSSPVLFREDERTAYRDPAVLYDRDSLYLFFTLVRTEADNKIYSYTARSQTQDLRHWSPVRIITPRDHRLDYSSPGNIVRFGSEWVLCLQTYPRPDYTADQQPRFGSRKVVRLNG